jgi:DNA-binding transcriptional LysR family regulator
MVRQLKFDFNLVRALEVFVTVVETKQITKAATMLGITQSAASQHLMTLETALGAKLINRASRPVELTKAGVALHRRAIRVLGEVEELRSDIRRIETAPLPLLRVCMLPSIATTLMSTVVTLARERFGIPEISAFAGLATDHQMLLRNRRADLAVSSDSLIDLDGLVRYPILRERFLLITPQAYRGQTSDLTALAQQLPLVRFSPSTPVGRRVDQHLRRIRLELPRSIDADRASMVLASVAANRGFTILSPTLLIDGFVEGMKLNIKPLPIAPFSREITLVALEKELGNLPQIFAQAIGDTLMEAINKLPGLPKDTVRRLDPNS